MNKRFISKVTMVLLFMALVFQAGYSVYSMIDERAGISQKNQMQLYATETVPQGAIQNIEVSQEIQEIIKLQYAEKYPHYLEKYKYFLVTLEVSPQLQSFVEDLLVEGYQLGDMMSAYDFLYQEYGTGEELKTLLKAQKEGRPWASLFKDYLQENIFVPRVFDTAYLEKLTQTPGIGSDDIMIADRIAHKTGEDFEGLIHRKLEGESWQEITTGLNILNGSAQLPRVQVTQEKLVAYAATGLQEDQVVEALVLANKLGFSEEAVIELVKGGQSREVILAAGYQEKYQ